MPKSTYIVTEIDYEQLAQKLRLGQIITGEVCDSSREANKRANARAKKSPHPVHIHRLQCVSIYPKGGVL